MIAPMLRSAIGVFDSGVGGLSVLRELRCLLPGEDLLYFADQANVPYGRRPLRQVRAFSEEITRFLLARGAKIVVVACNTASGAALHHLRAAFPQVPFVGMEPAVKPAAQRSRARAIGVIATPGTLEGELYRRVVQRFARDVRVVTHTCPGFVEEIEAGRVEGPALRSLAACYLEPLLAEGIDALVLGCTHYPFARKVIEEVAGPGVEVIDPAPAVARQVQRVLEERRAAARRSSAGTVSYFTSGEPARLSCTLRVLLGEDAEVRRVSWSRGRLVSQEGPGSPA